MKRDEPKDEWQKIEMQHASLLPATVAQQTFKIVSQKEREQATTLLETVKVTLKEIEGEANKILSPLNLALKQARAQRDKVMQPWENAKTFLKKVIENDIREQERLRLETSRKLEEAAKKEADRLKEKLTSNDEGVRAKAMDTLKTKMEKVVEKMTPLEVASYGVTTVRKVWKAEVVDFSALPDEFKKVDDGKIRLALSNRDAEGNPIAVPGVKFFKEAVV